MAYNPDEARDKIGRWTTGGAGADTSEDKRATDVGGDKWNKETAKRLEHEYATVRPVLDGIAKQVEDKNIQGGGGDDDEEHGIQSWDDMSGDQQQEAEEHYQTNNFDSALESEKSNWYDSGQALGESKTVLANDDDWKHEQMGEFLETRLEDAKDSEAGDVPRIPYTAEQLANALSIDYEDSSGEGTDKPVITFDDSKLQEPDTAAPKEQMTLPGVEPSNPSLALTENMRKEIRDYFHEKFDDEAERKASGFTPPDYLAESAKEYVENTWKEMSDEDKFQWTQSNTEIIPKEDDSSEPAVVRMPNEWDPLNETSGEDYKRTQAMAHYIFNERAQQIMKERGISGNEGPDGVYPGAIRSTDNRMWSDWKGSSTNTSSQILQVAASEELGGRFRGRQRPDDTALRAEFDKLQAENPNLKGDFETFKDNWGASTSTPKPDTIGEHVVGADGETYTRLPDISIVRNGLASTSTSPSVANDWGGTGNNVPAGIDAERVKETAEDQFASIGGYAGVKAMMRAKWETTQYMLDRADMPMLDVYRGINYPHTHTFSSSDDTHGRIVLRAEVPRTAVLSVPAYGVNVHSEHEVVVAGTAWKNWEAFSQRAPTYENVKPHAPAIPEDEAHISRYQSYRKEYIKSGDGDGPLAYADWVKITKPEEAYSVLKKGTSK